MAERGSYETLTLVPYSGSQDGPLLVRGKNYVSTNGQAMGHVQPHVAMLLHVWNAGSRETGSLVKQRLSRLTFQQRLALAILAAVGATMFACGGCCGFVGVVVAALAIGG